jgi:hypothetical protein
MPTGKFMKRNPPQAVDVVFRLDNQFAVKAMFKAMLTPKKGIYAGRYVVALLP